MHTRSMFALEEASTQLVLVRVKSGKGKMHIDCMISIAAKRLRRAGEHCRLVHAARLNLEIVYIDSGGLEAG